MKFVKTTVIDGLALANLIAAVMLVIACFLAGLLAKTRPA